MRRADWLKRLNAFVQGEYARPFAYGAHDCILFAARAVDAICDTQFVAHIQQHFTYADEATALEILNSRGGLATLITEQLGAPMDNPKFAAPGDVVLLKVGETEFAGVVVGHGLIAPGPTGLLTIPRRALTRAWSV